MILFSPWKRFAVAFFSPNMYKQAVKALGPHGPDAILAFLIFAGVIGAGMEFGFWPTALFGIAIFLIYGVRKHLHERHAEHMAAAEITKKQLAIEEFCVRQQVKQRKKALGGVAKPPAVKEVRRR